MRIGVGDAEPDRPGPKVRNSFGAHFVEVEVDTRARARPRPQIRRGPRLRPDHQPADGARARFKGGALMGIGMALHEDLLYDRRSGTPLNAGYYGARVLTHRDAPEIDVIFIESDDGLRTVRREEHRRGEQDAGAGRGARTRSSTRSAAG